MDSTGKELSGGQAAYFANSFVLYTGKKRTTSLLRSIGFHMPIELLQSGYTGTISYAKQIVNIRGEIFRMFSGMKSRCSPPGRVRSSKQAGKLQGRGGWGETPLCDKCLPNSGVLPILFYIVPLKATPFTYRVKPLLMICAAFPSKLVI